MGSFLLIFHWFLKLFVKIHFFLFFKKYRFKNRLEPNLARLGSILAPKKTPKMPPQNDQKTIKKSSRKKNQKKSKKEPQDGKKIPRCRRGKNKMGPYLPPAPPSKIRFAEWNATLSRFPLRSKPLSVISTCRQPSLSNFDGFPPGTPP